MAKWSITFQLRDHLVTLEGADGQDIDQLLNLVAMVGGKPYFMLPTQGGAAYDREKQEALAAAVGGTVKHNPRECPYHANSMRPDRQRGGHYCHTKLDDGVTWCGFKIEADGKIRPSRLDQQVLPNTY